MSTGHSLATTRLLSPPDPGTLVLKLGWTLTQPFYHTLPLLCQPPDPRDPYCLVSSLPHSKASMGKVFEKKGKPKGAHVSGPPAPCSLSRPGHSPHPSHMIPTCLGFDPCATTATPAKPGQLPRPPPPPRVLKVVGGYRQTGGHAMCRKSGVKGVFTQQGHGGQ